MQHPIAFYKDQIEAHQQTLSAVKTQLLTSSMLRLGVFLALIFGLWYFYGQTNSMLLILVLAFGLFLFLVSRHTDLQYRRDKIVALIKINKTEIEVQKRNFHQLPNGAEFLNSAHHYSQDVDLFGSGSFYQYSNRTSLQQGSEIFAQLLTANNTKEIVKRQDAVKELADNPKWRQDFSAIATLVKTETSYASIIGWMNSYRSFVPIYFRYLPWLFSVLSVVVIASYFLDWVSLWFLVGWFLLGLSITGRYLKKIGKLASDSSKIQSTFQQYQALILKLEHMDFKASLLRDKRGQILGDNEKASLVIRKFSRLLGGLEQRNNIIIGIFGNAFMLRDIQLSYSIESWILKHGAKVASWFEAIAFFDAYNSLGNFSFNHPNYTYPAIGAGNFVLKVSAASHPMLDPEKGIANSFEILEKEFFVITGANMAGKSTFLRTVALQIIMANTGLPVCAEKAAYSPIKLITSMRTSDSLTDDESYFFSELKRLKFIVDEIGNEKYFIVLDEILKGTNSTDKAKGSRKFLERLAATGSTGIIATHDLSLCTTADEFSEIKNYYFDAEIVNDELHFDYKLKKGICQNMNASFLLKKMGIVS